MGLEEKRQLEAEALRLHREAERLMGRGGGEAFETARRFHEVAAVLRKADPRNRVLQGLGAI